MVIESLFLRAGCLVAAVPAGCVNPPWPRRDGWWGRI